MHKAPTNQPSCPIVDDTAHFCNEKVSESVFGSSLELKVFCPDDCEDFSIHEISIGNGRGRASALIEHSDLTDLHSQIGEYLETFEKTSKE